MTWTIADTNTHQDHVIAHVIGASPLGHFTWDETAYILLDIGFIWNVYLDMEMGLVPQGVAIAELEADEATRTELRSYIDHLQGAEGVGPVQSVELLQSEDKWRLVLTCENGNLVVETEISHRCIRIISDASVAKML
jgi:hypothetical protein